MASQHAGIFPDQKRRVKVAVIGSGLAGLTAAYQLATSEKRPKDVDFEVHVFEKAATLGMDAHSISVSQSGGKDADMVSTEWRIDVPMRSFQGGYYPRLLSLYTSLGVHFVQADFSYSFSTLSLSPAGTVKPSAPRSSRPCITTTMIYNGDSGRAGVSMPAVLRGLRDAAKDDSLLIRLFVHITVLFAFGMSALGLLINYLRLAVLSSPVWRSLFSSSDELTFQQWVERTTPTNPVARWLGYTSSWRSFCNEMLVSMFSAVCTASREDVMQYPVSEFLDYIFLTLGTHHYVVTRGVRDVVHRLSKPIPSAHIHTGVIISDISPSSNVPGELVITTTNHVDGDASSQAEEQHAGFAHIVLATPAPAAAKLVEKYQARLEASSMQRPILSDLLSCLEAFQYRRTIVVNHTDDSLMPDDAQDRRDLNLINAFRAEHVVSQASAVCVDPSYTMATHVQRRPPGAKISQTSPDVYQTTNPVIPPRPDSILSVSHLDRAIVTQKSRAALPQLINEERQWWQSQGRGVHKLGELQGCGRRDTTRQASMIPSRVPGIWICGAYAAPGVPLLEGCVVSATAVVEDGVFACEAPSAL